MPQLLTQRGSVDNHGNPTAQTATNGMIISRTVSIQDLIHALSASPLPLCGEIWGGSRPVRGGSLWVRLNTKTEL